MWLLLWMTLGKIKISKGKFSKRIVTSLSLIIFKCFVKVFIYKNFVPWACTCWLNCWTPPPWRSPLRARSAASPSPGPPPHPRISQRSSGGASLRWQSDPSLQTKKKYILAYCGWDLVVRASDCQCRSRNSPGTWVRSQHPPTQWNLRGGRWSSVEYSTKRKIKKIPLFKKYIPLCVIFIF